MRYGNLQNRILSPAVRVLLILAVLGVSIGGVWAYLSYSAGNVDNLFTTAKTPKVTVGENYSVTVTADYAVYLRASIVLDWKNNTTQAILAGEPEGYTMTLGAGWTKHSDGFYYYTKAVNAGDAIQPVIQKLEAPDDSSEDHRIGYTLTADVAVQAIQALGTTDEETLQYPEGMPAVTAAWGIPVLTEGEHKGELDLPSS